MDLGNFKRETPVHSENLVVIAAYWKNMLDHIGVALDENMSSFKSKSNNAVSTIHKCASHLDEVAKGCAIVTSMGVIAEVVSGAMIPLLHPSLVDSVLVEH